MPYHIGFNQKDLGANPPEIALLSGDPERSRHIAYTYLQNVKLLSEYRGLHSYLGYLAAGIPVLTATSGMGAPSLSIVVNELIQVGIKKMIRIGTCGSIQPQIAVNSVVISQGALCRQGAANDIAPVEYPAVGDPFLTVALITTAQKLQIPYYWGITASVDTFYEGQERTESSANPHLQAWLSGITQQYRHLNILNYEMEAGTLFKMASVYDFAAACICGVVAQRTASEAIIAQDNNLAVARAIQVVIESIAQNLF
ncbi:MAG TPA: nucleoside phosphorylase [Xenococcaceae cyanobacterium]|jgi:uridine phosphorylase